MQVTLKDLVCCWFGRTDALIEAFKRWFSLAKLQWIALEEVLLHALKHVFRIVTRLQSYSYLPPRHSSIQAEIFQQPTFCILVNASRPQLLLLLFLVILFRGFCNFHQLCHIVVWRLTSDALQGDIVALTCKILRWLSRFQAQLMPWWARRHLYCTLSSLRLAYRSRLYWFFQWDLKIELLLWWWATICY